MMRTIDTLFPISPFTRAYWQGYEKHPSKVRKVRHPVLEAL